MMTKTQRNLARHALGLPNRQRRSYRNRYAASPQTDENRQWLFMVVAGWAELEQSAQLMHYRLTPEGARLALNSGDKLDPEDFPEAAAALAKIAGNK